MKHYKIIIFDGVCNFCNASVNFIIKRDPKGIFSFTPMQSEFAARLINKHKLSNVAMDTFILIKEDTCYVRTDAVLEVTKELTGYWFLFNITKILPRLFRDYFYTLFAKNRYRLFGQRATCMTPTPDIKNRFISDEK